MKRLIVSMLLLAVVGTACADVTTSAIEVNGETFGRGEVVGLLSDIQSEIDAEIRRAEAAGDINLAALTEQLGSASGTMDGDVSAQIVSIVVWNEVFRQQLSSEGRDVTESDIAAMAAEQQASGFDTFDELTAEFQARQVMLDPQTIERVVLEADVEIDPRFGVWLDGQVVPNYAVPVEGASDAP